MNTVTTTGGTPPTRRRSVSPRRRTAALSAFAAATALLLSACSTGSGAGTDTATEGAAGSLGTAAIQLSWLKNQQFAGAYVADDKGYFTDAGFESVELIAGGSSATSAEAAVTSGQALLGISAPLITAPAIESGAEVKIVGALYQKNPFAIVSSAEAPLTGADDLAGTTIAVSDSNTLVWNAFLAANDLSADDVTTVPLSDTSMLTTGQVDGYLGYSTTGAAALTASGFDADEFLLADAGLPLIGESIVASQDAIDNNRAGVEGLLEGLVRGWNDAIADPELAVDLTVDVYGKDQQYDRDSIALSVDRQAELISTDETEKNGLLTVSPELAQSTVDSLALAGIDISTDELFDFTLLDDVFEANPELR
ncbi:ABC transporter substrate-binding protein [Mycetocola reblochoni]|uniref:ABC transporter substrate-binding protein n=1 Tax=Mycetocola reblochoni TaxID=331618 RepID=UPI0016038DDD|nr:ABC transporter substrate-binding protein [Mycetocola reblochoni]